MTYNNVVTNLAILDRDGHCKYNATGKIALAGSNGISIKPDTDGSLLISADGAIGGDDPQYKNKYAKLISGGSGTAGGVPYTFSGQNNLPYYIATLNSAAGYENGYTFMLGSQCSQLGLFPDITGSEVEPAADPNTLDFYDICQACVDCYDYDRLCTYTDRIKTFIDDNKDKNIIADAGHTGSATISTGLYKQYLSLLHLWNYLVHAQNFIFTASADNHNVVLDVGYRCPFCGPYQDIEIDVELMSLVGDNYVKIATSYGADRLYPAGLPMPVACDYTDVLLPYAENGYKCTMLLDPTHTNPLAMSKGYYIIRNLVWAPYVELPVTCVPPDYDPPCPYRPKRGFMNTWTVRVTWRNTHAGTAVTRTRVVMTNGVTII